jgi:hypothetical protein
MDVPRETMLVTSRQGMLFLLVIPYLTYSTTLRSCGRVRANPTVMVIQILGKKSIQTHRDIVNVPRHIIKNVSKRVFGNIQSPVPVTVCSFFFLKIDFGQRILDGKEEMSIGNREDNTASVQIEEIKCAITALPFVTKLSPVRVHKSHGAGWGVSLTCSASEEYDSCGKKQEPPVQVSSVHPTEVACLQELLKRLQDRHVDCAESVPKKAVPDAASADTVDPDAPNVLQAMMLFQQVKKNGLFCQWMMTLNSGHDVSE